MKSGPGTLRVFMLLAVLPLVTHGNEVAVHIRDPRTAEASALMLDFARRTGLDSQQPPRRYLWTDAFAVCNFLGLAHSTGESRYRELALRLVDQVHHVLGRHRDDDRRRGWISGLSAGEGERHPTIGGLRIGKRLPERGPDERYDERLEWDQDGQYFHYLSKWMHALDQTGRAAGDPRYPVWARELALAAHKGFTYRIAPGRATGMYWKMSIDLSRPLVSSMGQHDPLEGYLAAVQLQTTAAALPRADKSPDLKMETGQFKDMLTEYSLATSDPLGIGGLLTDAYRLMQLIKQGGPADKNLLGPLFAAALSGLKYYLNSGELQAPPESRLAFRELGLAIGLSAVERMGGEESKSTAIDARLEDLKHYVQVGMEIEAFWRNPKHQDNPAWTEHRDINEVMLATRLAPEGFLVLKFRRGRTSITY